MRKYLSVFLLFPAIIIFFVAAKQIQAGWVVDVDNPFIIPLTPQPNCYTTASWSAKSFNLTVNDLPLVTGISSVDWVLTSDTSPYTPVTGNAGSATFNAGTWNITTRTTNMVDNNSYRLIATATDKVGNKSTTLIIILSFKYKTTGVCGTPWIQTIGGDVHSNNSISIPTPAP